jgi:hypothetical protein
MIGGALLTMSGCGGGASTLALSLTDAPADLATIRAALFTIGPVDVHVAGGGDEQGDAAGGEETGWLTLDHPAETFDLLLLQNEVVAPLGEFHLPTGKITQIRVHLDAAGRNEIHLADGRICPLDLADVAAEGVKINHPFKALDLQADHTTSVVVDFDLRESLSHDGDDACAFRLKPVIKLASSRLD